MARLKVLGRVTSINVRKVVWVLDELGAAYEREDWAVGSRDPNVPEFLGLNPNATVPVIVDDGFVLWESNVIMRYFVEKDGRGALLPSLIRHRAIVEQWLQWQATELNPPWRYAFNALRRKREGYTDETKIADSIAKWSAKMAILEARLQQAGEFVAREKFSLADVALGLSVHRWFETEFDRPDLPLARAYYERLKRRPAGAKYMTSETP
jgi:glutathione S-transferase